MLLEGMPVRVDDAERTGSIHHDAWHPTLWRSPPRPIEARHTCLPHVLRKEPDSNR